MLNRTRVCGLMLAYFKAEMTKKCLDSLVNQGIDNLILVDNSANPEENQRTLELTKHYPLNWLKIITAPENLGFAKGMNLALRHARELGDWDYLLILNNDIQAESDLVEQLTNHLNQNPKIVLLSTSAYNGTTIQSGLYYQRLTGLMFNKPTIGSFHVAPGYCLLLRSIAIRDEIFDQRFFMYGEDVELSWRFLKQNQDIQILAQPLLTHIPAQSSQEASLFYEYYINRGHWLLVESLSKNILERCIMYILRLPFLILRAIFRSWRFRCLSPLRAVFLVSLGLPLQSSKNN